MSLESEDVFSFTPSPETHADATPAAGASPAAVLDVDREARAIHGAGLVSYHWDIATDVLTWSSNAASVLGCDGAQMATGRTFAAFLDNENITSRYETVVRSSQRDLGQGIAYEIEYMFRPEGRRSGNAIWVEDFGRWHGDDSGTPREAVGVMRLANARHARDQQMNFLSNCDPLTGMMNRGRMEDALGEAISVASAEKSNCAFAIVSIKNLAVMNETYGFEVADEVIAALGTRLRKVMRVGDAIARYSGSTFGIILNGCNPDELSSALERFMRAVRDSVIETQLGPVWALLSIGAVSLPALGEDAATAIANAEEALSEAVRRPGDGYVIFTSSEERKTRRALNAMCAKEIVNCLRDGLFRLAFQPVVEAGTGAAVMHEALLRMPDSTGEMITAGHLVPIAESLGLIRLIDRAVLQLALDTLQAHPAARLSINVSATTANDPRWNVQLVEMLAAAPDLAARLMVEINEMATRGQTETIEHFAARLRACGCAVALDDFGAGYSASRNLRSLPITHLKMDGRFCTHLEDGGENRIFVKSMVELAHAFGLKVVAEWVENAEDCETLVALGVDFLQGHHFGQASLEPPWQDADGALFDLTATQATAGDTEAAAPVHDEIGSTADVAEAGAPKSTVADISQPGAADEAAPVEPTEDAAPAVLAVTEGEPEGEMAESALDAETALLFDETDDHLAHLREALAALNAAFPGPSTAEDTGDTRLAS